MSLIKKVLQFYDSFLGKKSQKVAKTSHRNSGTTPWYTALI